MKVLNEFMASLSPGDAVESYLLKIMPIFVDEDRELPYVVLEEALKQGWVEITETSEGDRGQTESHRQDNDCDSGGDEN